MSFNIEIILVAAAILIYIDIVVVCLLLVGRLNNDEKRSRHSKDNQSLIARISGNMTRKATSISIGNYLEMKQFLRLERENIHSLESSINAKHQEKRFKKQLRAFSTIKRSEAAVYLGVLGSEEARLALEKAVAAEKKYSVKLYMANALADIGNKESLPTLIKTLYKAPDWYKDKANMLIADFGAAFEDYLPEIINSDDLESKQLILDFASSRFSSSLKKYLLDIVEDQDHRIRAKAVSIIAEYYPQELAQDRYLNSDDLYLKNAAVSAMSASNNVETIWQLIELLKSDTTAKSAGYALSTIIERTPGYINMIIRAFEEEHDGTSLKSRLAGVLANRAEYFIFRLNSKNKLTAASILRQFILLGKTTEIIDFINQNKDIDLENELLAIIRSTIVTPELELEIRRYVQPRILQKLGLAELETATLKKESKPDKKLISRLYFIMIMSGLVFPLAYFVRHYGILYTKPLFYQLRLYVLEFNYLLIYYSIAINLIYLALLFFSYISANKQNRLWGLKSITMLFKKKILPSISIIAPAYNESKTIIESANSLLNLRYPDYELIIVNDGSKDNTLEVLINGFELTRVNYLYSQRIETKAVRGVYVNRSIPKLVVVDKENGGKADSLNVGINTSNKEYFCGIDADSLLEDDALLKLVALTIDEETDMPALGGNICTINGCSVERGVITEVRVPKSRLARLQTIEYNRAFMAGRLGWAYLKSLLIISGAFGLFKKERVIEAGGYLTSSGKYQKDTVGEDMELVVRLSRLMHEKRQNFQIGYAFNANCWTEVPEDIKSLKSQRLRWHRGLIDILSFHKGMLFNPRYGRTGTVALPYFLIFEVIGPLIEIQGYAMIVLAYFLGILSLHIALLLFISTILAGLLISVSSLLIAEKDVKYLRYRDIAVLIVYAVLENFGPRQMFSLWRVGGFISMLKNSQGWGKLERKGFTAAASTVKG